MSQIITQLSEISHQYDALFVDLWGCVHNGVRAFEPANQALIAYRKTGGKVVLVTNSPRPRSGVEQQLREFGVSDDAWDTIATSGDSARSAMFQGVVGQNVYFIGTEAELPFFEPLKLLNNPISINRVPVDQAEGIVCTGLGPDESPEDYKPQLMMAKQMGLKFLCANPDIVVDRGHKREWCAGAVAQMYSEMVGNRCISGNHIPRSMTLRAVVWPRWANLSQMTASWPLAMESTRISKGPWAKILILCSFQGAWLPKKPKPQINLIPLLWTNI